MYYMTTLEIYFRGPKKTPYIYNQQTFEYVCDGITGSLCFDRYYYIEDSEPVKKEEARYSDWLPQTLDMYVKRREVEPYKNVVNEHGYTTFFYTVVEEHLYTIEIYKRVIHESTDQISQVEDEDGEEMNVCFFPTNKQTIYFRILAKN
uniref:Uncharacterized protein n=1 Tax=viral metagenome TaxID=1070528 RepID=A0A6C0KW32_9ZZZZ